MTRRHRRNLDSVAIGRYAGEESTTENTVSVGRKSGYSAQEQYAIAIGDAAGEETQGLNAIAIGAMSGQTSQSTFAIAIGDQAGRKNQGANAIAIGSKAGLKDQPASSIIISTSNTEIVATKKGLYIDPIRKFDDREGRPTTVKEGNVLSYNYKNDTPDETKEVVTGFPRLPGYPTDAEVALAIKLTAEDAGTMYFDTTKKKIKVYNGTKWVALADEDDLAKLKAAAGGAGSAAGAAMAGGSGSVVGSEYGSSQFVTGGSVGGGSGNPVTVVGPDGKVTAAVPGVDFYWEDARNIGQENGYYPIFYNDLTKVSDRVPDNTNNPNAPGNYVTTYSNGHQSIEPIPTSVWNPPLDAFNNLPDNERRELIAGYGEHTGATFLTWPVEDRHLNNVESYGGAPFRDYLTSKGVTGT